MELLLQCASKPILFSYFTCNIIWREVLVPKSFTSICRNCPSIISSCTHSTPLLDSAVVTAEPFWGLSQSWYDLSHQHCSLSAQCLNWKCKLQTNYIQPTLFYGFYLTGDAAEVFWNVNSCFVWTLFTNNHFLNSTIRSQKFLHLP